MWGDVFGERSAQLARQLKATNTGNEVVTDSALDDTPIDGSLWQKGTAAPGAIDQVRRLDVMDAMGVERMVVFRTGPGLLGLLLATVSRDILMRHLSRRFGALPEDFHALGRDMVGEHNDWCAAVATTSPRLYPVACLLTNSVAQAVGDVERLVDRGVRNVMIAGGIPPNGVSPGHPDVDPLWRILTETNTSVYLHVGGEFGFAAEEVAWRDAPSFTAIAHSDEVNLEAFSFSVAHFGPQNYLSAMILGGVFDRHPTLRVGAMEYGAQWIGPMSDNLQTWYDHFRRRAATTLRLPIREYVERNIRCSVFPFEDVDTYIDRHGLESVYCYASDYPHIEGGINPLEQVGKKVAPYGDDVLEKLFVTNAELLLTA